ncbi:MAG: sugar phosphate isomerase/epimerase family protein [Gemmataceae bacterium]
MKIGLCLETLGLPVRRGIAAAEKFGVAGVQIDAVGDLAPRRLGDTGRRELRHLLRSHGLELSALRAPLRHGLDVPDDLQPRIDRIKEVMSLSRELGAGIVVAEVGRIPDGADDPRAPFLTEALTALGHHGDRIGAVLALETGLEPGDDLAKYLATFDTGGLGVNYDPANLLMNGFEPLAQLGPLVGKIVHAHAKDARSGGASRSAREVPLGHGDIDWLALCGTLAAAEYRGYLAVERDGGDDKAGDVAAGVAFLRRLM